MTVIEELNDQAEKYVTFYEPMNSGQVFLLVKSWNFRKWICCFFVHTLTIMIHYVLTIIWLELEIWIILLSTKQYQRRTITKSIHHSYKIDVYIILNLFTGDMNIKYNFSFFYCLSFCLFKIIINSSIAISCKYNFILFNTICLSSSFHSQIAICLLRYITLLENNSWTNSWNVFDHINEWHRIFHDTY